MAVKRKKLKLTAREQKIVVGINALVKACHGASRKAGWYNNPRTGKPLKRNRGEMLMLIVSEVAEAMEGERKGLRDDKLPHRPMAEVEMADAVIREADFCGFAEYDLAGAVIEKLRYNKKRPDHKLKNRRKAGGKKF